MRKAFTLVEIMIVVAIVGIILAIAIPAFLRARETSRATACQANLKQIFTAKETWGNEVGAESKEIPKGKDLFGEGKYIVNTPECPSGGSYTINTIGANPECSIGTSLKQKKWFHCIDQEYPKAL